MWKCQEDLALRCHLAVHLNNPTVRRIWLPLVAAIDILKVYFNNGREPMKTKHQMTNEQLRCAINETLDSLRPIYNAFGAKCGQVSEEEREMLLSHLGELLAAEKARAAHVSIEQDVE